MKTLSILVLALVAACIPLTATSATTRPFQMNGLWPTYLGGNARDGFAGDEMLISKTSAATLAKRWSVKAGSSVSDEPIVAGGVVYWGSWDGYEHATTIFGKPLWSAYVGRTVTGQQCNPSAVGVAGTAVFARIRIQKTVRPVVFVPGGDAQLYALNALTGSRTWHAQLGELGTAFLWDRHS